MVNNENLIPKTETVYELKNEIPSYEEFLKTWKKDELVNASYESEINGLEKGYGPCRYTNKNCTCFVNQNPKWIQLYIACPGSNCGNRETYSWVHASDSYPIYISTDLDLKCVSCDRPSHMLNWRFNCYSDKHPGDFIGTSYSVFLNALSLVGGDIQNRDPRIRDAIRMITNKLFDRM